jgi:hypothetical protein
MDVLTHTAHIGALDDIAVLPKGNEIEALWEGVVTAYSNGCRLAQHRDRELWGALGTIARLYDGVAASSNDPETAWWRFLAGKQIRQTRRRPGAKRSLFYGLIERLSNQYASQDETCSKSVISRRAAVLQHWHDHERTKIAADQVAEWIASSGGVKAVAAIASPPKPPMTKAEQKAARADRGAWFHRLVESDPLTSMNWNVLPDNLRPFADGRYRLALIRVWETDASAGADIIGIPENSEVSQGWLNRNAQGLVEHLPVARSSAVQPPSAESGQ